MNRLVIFTSLFLALAETASAADTFSCQSPSPSRHSGKIDGSFESWSDSRKLLSYSLEIKANCGKDDRCQYQTTSQEKMLANRKNYRPYKNLGKVQFIIPTKFAQSNIAEGSIQILMPKQLGPSFEATIVLSKIEDSFGFNIPLYCQVLSSEDSQVVESGNPDVLIGEANKMVHQQFGLTGLELDIDRDSLEEQLATPSKVSFLKALKGALINLLNDEDHVESPLALARIGVNDDWGHRVYSGTLVDAYLSPLYLRQSLDQDSTLYFSYRPFPPEEGERSEDYWIFRLEASALSDHIFWSIGAKDGSQEPYNYGFN